MTDYHVVRADGTGTIATFDRWGQHVVDRWHREAKRHAVNLICMWSCGCLRRALVRHRTVWVAGKMRRRKIIRIHTGWRRFSVCDKHARKPRGKP